MALRASEEDCSNSPVPSLQHFWQEAAKPPTYEWEQWIQLFEVAVFARHSISVTELTREVTQDNPRVAAMMGNLEEEPAKRKVTSLLYISIGKAGRRMLMDKFAHINNLLIQLNNILHSCAECFQTSRNKTLDRQTFLSRKQKPTESLHQFWNILNSLAAKSVFSNQTEGLVYNIFVLNKANKQVQEKLCTEPKDNPNEALQFAIAFEDGLRRQKTYGYIAQDHKIREEPICTVSESKQNDRECWRCGAGNFTMEHLKVCKTQSAMCNYCGRKGHLNLCVTRRKMTIL